ncbi:hypothetical protein Vretimale_9476 [Volvox reticuliferus]|nr:hypothetical protein Vretifemale_18719 [Volvox reticuliferus]GIM05003.1 hypothetical protein Vretimale_9476 [Volvox reticuliferus]
MFTTKEAMTGNNQYQCPRCGTYRDADLQMRITEGPNVLVVHLKRFGKTEKANKEGSKGQPEEEAEDERGDEQVAQKEDAVVTKIDKHVAFELALDLSPYMTTTARGDRENGGVSTKGTDGSRGSNTYTLYSVLTHRGDTLQSGHYVSFVRDGEGEWWLKNDETTVPVALDDVLRQQAYMLFYCRDAVSPTTPLQEPVPVADGAAASLRQRVAASRLERVEQPEVGTSAHHQTRNRLRLSRDGHSPSSSSGGGHSDRNSGGFGVAEVGKKGREGGGNGYPTGSGEPAVSPASPAGPCSWGSSACLQSREGSGGGSCVCGCTSPTSCGMGHGICTAGSCSPGAGGSSSLLFTLGFRDGAASAVPPPCGSASTRGGPGAREERKRKRQSAGDGCTDSGD